MRIPLGSFLATPGIEDDRLELIDGEVYQKPMPTFDHGDLQIEIGALLKRFGRASSEARTIMPAAGTRQDSALLPDIVFFRSDAPREHGHVTRSPHLAVEILSPGQSRLEARAKVDIYLAAGVEAVWVVDPERREVEVYERGSRRTLGQEDRLETASVPGLSILTGEIFETLDR